jgi:hypothetical protein
LPRERDAQAWQERIRRIDKQKVEVESATAHLTAHNHHNRNRSRTPGTTGDNASTRVSD